MVRYGLPPLVLTLTLGLINSLRSSSAAEAPASAAGTAPRERAIAVDVRSAPLSQVLARAAAATGVPMTAVGAAGDQRVTLHAGRTTAAELRTAFKDLLRLQVTRRGTAAAPRFALLEDSSRAAQQEAWRLKQHDAFLQALVKTAGSMTADQEEATARSVRERFQREHPEVDAQALASLTPGYLRQTLLATPLTPLLRGQLVRTGEVARPLWWLAPYDQALLAAFARGGAGREALSDYLLAPDLGAARVQFRLLYGDRWSDEMLLTQVGHARAWTPAMLPFILFRQKDDSALYPPAAERPDDPDVWRRLPPQFETAGKDWDSVLVDLASTMEIKLAADAYARPWLFHPERALPSIVGIPLRDALDRLCQEHGCFWWKQDDWYFIRSRSWVEEIRVSVPDRLLHQWVESVHRIGQLTGADLLQLAALSDEQLLTLDLGSRAPGEAQFLGSGFDPDKVALMASGLLLFRSLPPALQEMALTDGVPALWLPPALQSMFAGVAADQEMALLPEEAESWNFRIRQQFADAGAPAEGAADNGQAAGAPGGAVARTGFSGPISGEVSVEWRFGPEQRARASVAISDRTLHRTEEAPNPSVAR